MSATHSSKRPGPHDVTVMPPSVVNQQPREASATHIPPSSQEVQRLIERRRAQQLDIEFPMSIAEAAGYVGRPRCEVEELAYAGRIPAHHISSEKGDWVFYPSELDLWLRDEGQAGGEDASSRI